MLHSEAEEFSMGQGNFCSLALRRALIIPIPVFLKLWVATHFVGFDLIIGGSCDCDGKCMESYS